MLDLLCRNSKYTLAQDLDHDLNRDIHHVYRHWHLGVRFKTSEEILNTLEDVYEGIHLNLPSEEPDAFRRKVK